MHRNKLMLLFGTMITFAVFCLSCNQLRSTPRYLPKFLTSTDRIEHYVFPDKFSMEINLNEGSYLIEAPIMVCGDNTRPLLKATQVCFSETIYKGITAYFTKEDISIKMGTEKSISLRDGTPLHCVLFPDYLSMQLDKDGLIQLESWVQAGDAYPGEPYGTQLENIQISLEHAIRIAENALFDLEMHGMIKVSSQKARVIDENNDTISEGWYLGFKKESNYIDVDLNFLAPFEDSIESCVSDKTAPFSDEMIYMYITEKGVRFFRWDNPYIISEILAENVDLVPFDRIQENMRLFFDARYSDNIVPDEWLPTLKSVLLTSCHIRDKDNQNGSILTPTWMFVFSSAFIEKHYMTPFALSFSAIDGEKIDPLYIQ